jgi:hypothetical protein
MCLENLGNVRRAQGRLQSAGELLERSLTIADDTFERSPYLAGLVESIAGLAAAGARPEDAIRLDAAAVAFRASIGAPRGPADEEHVASDLGQAVAGLGDELAALRDEGAKMDVDAMVALGRSACRGVAARDDAVLNSS